MQSARTLTSGLLNSGTHDHLSDWLILSEFGRRFRAGRCRQIGRQAWHHDAHEFLQPLVGVGFRLAGIDRRGQPHQRAVGPVFQQGVAQQIELRPIFIGDLHAALFEPVIDQLFLRPFCDDHAVERQGYAGIIAGVVRALEIGDDPAIAGNADGGRMRRGARALVCIVGHIEVDRAAVASGVVRQNVVGQAEAVLGLRIERGGAPAPFIERRRKRRRTSCGPG